MMTIQPLLNSLAFLFEKYGIEVNYGLARGLGSAAYALASAVLGYLVEDFGTSMIPLFYIIGNILLIVVVYTYVVPKNQRHVVHREENQHEEVKQEQLSFFQFCSIYKKFMIFVVGVILVFFTHTIINKDVYKRQNWDYAWSTRNGIKGLLERVQESLGTNQEYTGIEIFDMANEGNEKVIEGISQFCKEVATQIFNVHIIFDCEKVAIGGGIRCV